MNFEIYIEIFYRDVFLFFIEELLQTFSVNNVHFGEGVFKKWSFKVLRYFLTFEPWNWKHVSVGHQMCYWWWSLTWKFRKLIKKVDPNERFKVKTKKEGQNSLNSTKNMYFPLVIRLFENILFWKVKAESEEGWEFLSDLTWNVPHNFATALSFSQSTDWFCYSVTNRPLLSKRKNCEPHWFGHSPSDWPTDPKARKLQQPQILPPISFSTVLQINLLIL